METNIFSWVMSQMKDLPLEEQKVIFSDLLKNLSKEEKIVIFLDMLDALNNRTTIYKDNAEQVIKEIQGIQDTEKTESINFPHNSNKIFDKYNAGNIDKTEMIKQMKEILK